ncbi:Panacea domain-containing protein [Neokomagataea anthophila]|uniref:SocA family protein n=1 Tax=Neokomagataea anthophila TaxID=2826925 RepID=A0ABS5E7Z6_9PROT|nr:Panacea domain-containing protein [Neokomagataea anthophila]MBR0560035.1 SocA family protein [Neokomagataea anthophila]
MPAHSPIAVANEFIKRMSSSATPNQMQIQKLVYIANGWNLAINGCALVDENPEAWDGGPVFRKIWNSIRDFGYSKQEGLLQGVFGVPKDHFTPDEENIIDHVWKKYGIFSGYELSEMTHRPDTPWTDTYINSGRNAKIPHDLVRKHFIKLAVAGRSAA